MMTILTRGGWHRRKHGALACVTPAIGIVPGRHAIHRHRHCRGPPAADERHTLLFEHRALPLRAAEREAGRQRTVTEHDAMAGNHAGFGIGVQREADEPRIAWAAGQRRDLAVGRDRSARDPPDDVIHRTVERCRTIERRCAAG